MPAVDVDYQDNHWESRRRYRDPRSKAAAAFARPKLEWLAQALDIDSTSSVLDVGAGNGMFTWWWPALAGRVEGIELSGNMIGRSPCPERIRQGDAYGLPFDDGTFDVVFAGNLLHHLARPVDALREMARVSRRSVAVIECNKDHLPMRAFGVVSPVCRGLLDYTEGHLRRLAAEAGLDVVALRAHGYVYENRSPTASLPIARWLERRSRGGAYLLMAASKQA